MFHENRQKFINTLIKKISPDFKRPVFLMKSAEPGFYHQGDIEDAAHPQESNFYYLTGVKQYSCHLAIDLVNKESTLFCDRMPAQLAMWMSLITKEDMKKWYDVETRYNDELEAYLKNVNPDQLILVEGVNTDSGTKSNCIPKFQWLDSYASNKSIAYHVLEHCRSFKSPTQVIVMKQAYKMAAEGHMSMMREARVGMIEDQLSAHFIFHCHKHYNQKFLSYPTISTGGLRSAMAHYFSNHHILKDGDMLLNDSGMNLHLYSSDITTSFPLNGKFTQKQKDIYNIVLKANRTVQKESKPGVLWSDNHILAERIILQGLQQLGIVKKDAVINELIEKRVGALFMHHGLGHLIGLDTHDVGGYIPQDPMCKARILQPGLKCLRHNRILEPGLVTTNEPGCYFVEALLKGEVYPEIDRSAIDIDKAFEYRKEVAGVRIEDALLITEIGCENLTPACLPRSVEEIEAYMNLEK